MSISKLQNVDIKGLYNIEVFDIEVFDIEGPTFDIGVASLRIQMSVRSPGRGGGGGSGPGPGTTQTELYIALANKPYSSRPAVPLAGLQLFGPQHDPQRHCSH
jgi:hypothetical protein